MDFSCTKGMLSSSLEKAIEDSMQYTNITFIINDGNIKNVLETQLVVSNS